MTLILIAIGTLVATFVGGFVALRYRDRLHLILGFSAGAVISVAFFDLLPESISLGIGTYDVSVVTSLVALGFLVYLILDRTIFLHSHSHDEDDHDHMSHSEHAAVKRGVLGASTLSIHSLLDGVAVGLAFQASTSVGIIVAVAVLCHDFSDGINTVGLIVKNSGSRTSAFKWLIVDAIAPVLGIISTLFFSLPENKLSLLLATFTGFFLYIGATDLIPESHHSHPKMFTTIMTLVGAGVLYLAIQIANV